VGLYGRTDSNNTSNEVLLSDIPLAWLNINLFTQNSYSRAGLTSLKLWEQRFIIQAHPDGTLNLLHKCFNNLILLLYNFDDIKINFISWI
jgi:hypothetical protein